MQVLHYHNALVSMQLTLLRDEAREAAAGASCQLSTAAAKEFTCPVRFARTAAKDDEAGPGAGVQPGGGPAGKAPADAGPAGYVDEAWPDDWLEDAEAGVAVRDWSGRCGGRAAGAGA